MNSPCSSLDPPTLNYCRFNHNAPPLNKTFWFGQSIGLVGNWCWGVQCCALRSVGGAMVMMGNVVVGRGGVQCRLECNVFLLVGPKLKRNVVHMTQSKTWFGQDSVIPCRVSQYTCMSIYVYVQLICMCGPHCCTELQMNTCLNVLQRFNKTKPGARRLTLHSQHVVQHDCFDHRVTHSTTSSLHMKKTWQF